MAEKYWNALKANYSKNRFRKINDLFNDQKRFESFNAESAGVFLDFSKTNIDLEAKKLLIKLVTNCGFHEKRKSMFSGEVVNPSENRAALHFALRDRQSVKMLKNSSFVLGVHNTLGRMKEFANQIRSGATSSSSGEKFSDVINIGIGGSDLGPRMTTNALIPYCDGPKCHFIANVDSAEVADTLKQLNPKKTLLIIVSKTFKTVETMTNAKSVISWLRQSIPDEIGKHLVAVTSAPTEAKNLNISADRIFEFSSTVGGRYSIWGPVGLPLMLSIGPKFFEEFLSGAAEIDSHFLNAELESNLPVLMGITGIWHRNICEYPTRAVLPYEHRLRLLPAYLQQLDMESNGKRVCTTGQTLELESVPIVWGATGTNSQHAFFQMLHQGTSVVPCEFLISAKGHEESLRHHHDLLIANCLAQSEALMKGESYESTVLNQNFRECPGNRPSITILFELLTPKLLGSLIALFEHRTFVEGIVWNVNSFDQWGVELGKKMSEKLLPAVKSQSDNALLNGSTAGLLRKLKEF